MNRGIELLILDRPRHLRFDFNVIADLEMSLGIGIGEIFKAERTGFATVRACMYYGLRWEDPKLTLAKVGDLLTKAMNSGVNFQQLVEPISQAIKEAKLFPDADADEGVDPNVGTETVQ